MSTWAQWWRRVQDWMARASTTTRRRWRAFEALWRRSLQVRVVVSTLALSSAVVFVLGMVLQTQITNRLLETKKEAAVAQTNASLPVVERELIGVDPSSETLPEQLSNALNRLTRTGSRQNAADSTAGAFIPVLVDGYARTSGDGAQPAAGPISRVPPELRRFVERNQLASQFATPPPGNVTYLVVGAPVRSATRPLQMYLLFPLTAEQNTVGVVRNTLVVGSAVLLLLIGAITNLVTRQVVRPVRHAARIAEQFARGDLDERMRVVGEDDMARLAESFNEMAANLKQQITQLEEFGQLQRRFTSDVSHELRTPLTTVRMAADVLYASRDEFPEGLSRSTELMVTELNRFEALLNDLLEISRLDAGVADLAEEPMDMVDLVHRAAESVRGIAVSEGVEVHLDLPGDEVQLTADVRRVERIVRNLLGNAIDHAEGNPVYLRVVASEEAVAVAVRDFGVGLRPGEAELVFTRFWRADPSRNRRTGGTGLGLAISLEDARLHGGWLDAWGEPGGGSCFRLTLPRRPGDPLTESPLPMPDTRRIAAPNALLAAPQDRRGSAAQPPQEEGSIHDEGPARLVESDSDDGREGE